MAIAFRASNKAVVTSGTSITVTKPTGTTSGDILVVCLGATTSRTLTPSDGETWTEIQSGNSTFTIWSYWHLCGGSEPASYSFSVAMGESSTRLSAIMAGLSGVDNTTPINVSDEVLQTGTTINSPDITTTSDGCMILTCIVVNGTTTITDPTGFTFIDEIEGHDPDSAFSYMAQASAGATGTLDWALADSRGARAHSIALEPAAAAAGSVGVGLLENVLLARRRLVN